jgi:hypothetical protein
MDVRRAAGFVVLAIGAVLLTLAVLSVGMGALGALARGNLLALLGLVPFALFGIGLPFVMVVVGRRLVRVRPTEVEPPSPAVPRDPVGPVQASDLAELKPPFTACPDCGYLGVRAPGIRDGLWPGGGETGGRFVCPRCHYQGIPVEFGSGEEYVAFVRALHAPQ